LDNDNCSDSDEEESVASVKAKIPRIESLIATVSRQLEKVDEFVKHVLETLKDEDLEILKGEVSDATERV